MKALKIIIILVLVLVAAFFITGLIVPKDFQVERSVIIQAPNNIVFEQVSFFENMDKWSPWNEYDPDMKTEIEGTDGEVGAISKWEGNKDVGKGMQEFIKIVPGERVETKLTFIEPYEGESNASILLEDLEEGTKVFWTFYGTTPYPFNTIMLFQNVDEKLGGEFVNGLNKLKTLCEKNVEEHTFRGYFVEEVPFHPVTYIAKKATLSFNDMQKFYEKNLPAMFEAVQKNNIQMQGAPSGLFYEWDMETYITKMAAGIPVAPGAFVKGFDTIQITMPNALKIAYFGGYEKSGDAHYAMDDYMKSKGYTQLPPVVEEYITDPAQEPDTTKWLTNIYYFYKN